MKKAPSWLVSDRYILSGKPRKELPVDNIDGDGDVFDICKPRPSYRYCAAKKAKKDLEAMEEWVKFLQKKKGNS